MPRLARVAIAGMPHQVTQRGNRRQQTFEPLAKPPDGCAMTAGGHGRLAHGVDKSHPMAW